MNDDAAEGEACLIRWCLFLLDFNFEGIQVVGGGKYGAWGVIPDNKSYEVTSHLKNLSTESISRHAYITYPLTSGDNSWNCIL